MTPDNTRLKPIKGKLYRVCRICQRHTRPIFVVHDGVKIYVRPHDTWHLAERLRLWQKRLAAHPDKGGTNAAFVRANRQYVRFMERERAWYRALALPLPIHRVRKRQSKAVRAKAWATRLARFGATGHRNKHAQCMKAWATRRAHGNVRAQYQKMWATRRMHQREQAS